MKTSAKKTSIKYKFGGAVSIVSHQLKTPLSAIKGFLEVLISEDLGGINTKQKEYLDDALKNTHRMIRLVKDILDVSQIEEKKMELKPEPSNLETIVKETIQEFSAFAKAKNCTISFESSGQIPLLNIDPLKIKQVITNIIINAIEYNERKGRVEISLKKEQNYILFCCKDNGIGIPENEKNKVFTKFYRNAKAITLTGGGSGLGLFISKAIVEISGGKIWFESKKGQGSTFCFRLPIKQKIKYEKN